MCWIPAIALSAGKGHAADLQLALCRSSLMIGQQPSPKACVARPSLQGQSPLSRSAAQMWQPYSLCALHFSGHLQPVVLQCIPGASSWSMTLLCGGVLPHPAGAAMCLDDCCAARLAFQGLLQAVCSIGPACGNSCRKLSGSPSGVRIVLRETTSPRLICT